MVSHAPNFFQKLYIKRLPLRYQSPSRRCSLLMTTILTENKILTVYCSNAQSPMFRKRTCDLMEYIASIMSSVVQASKFKVASSQTKTYLLVMLKNILHGDNECANIDSSYGRLRSYVPSAADNPKTRSYHYCKLLLYVNFHFFTKVYFLIPVAIHIKLRLRSYRHHKSDNSKQVFQNASTISYTTASCNVKSTFVRFLSSSICENHCHLKCAGFGSGRIYDLIFDSVKVVRWVCLKGSRQFKSFEDHFMLLCYAYRDKCNKANLKYLKSQAIHLTIFTRMMTTTRTRATTITTAFGHETNFEWLE
uniref:Uncharacterized protein n=1 Tax=Glossina austeni TaxID=7395 RepID=A0A1A9URU7_GLOAU